MDNAILDKEYQRKTTVQSLVESAGMRLFKEELNDALAYVDAEINSAKKGFIQSSRLDKLNFDLGMRKGLEMVVNILVNFEDEIVGDNVKSQK